MDRQGSLSGPRGTEARPVGVSLRQPLRVPSASTTASASAAHCMDADEAEASYEGDAPVDYKTVRSNTVQYVYNTSKSVVRTRAPRKVPVFTTRVVHAFVQLFEEQCRLNASLRNEVGSMQSQLLDIQRMLQMRGAGASSGADDGDTDENSQRAGADQQTSRAPAASEPDARVCH